MALYGTEPPFYAEIPHWYSSPKKKNAKVGKIQWLKILANSTCSIFLGCYNVSWFLLEYHRTESMFMSINVGYQLAIHVGIWFDGDLMVAFLKKNAGHAALDEISLKGITLW